MLDTEMETRLKPPAASGAQQGSSLFTHFEDVQVAEHALYARSNFLRSFSKSNGMDMQYKMIMVVLWNRADHYIFML